VRSDDDGCLLGADDTDSTDYSDDGVLVAGLRAGDDDAFAWLLDQHDRPLRRLARTFVGSAATADEVVQETWVAVIEGIDRFEQRSSVKTWIHRILMNKARTRGVRDKRDGPLPGPTFPAHQFLPDDHPRWPGHWAVEPATWEGLPQQQLEARETLDRVRAAIAELPEVHRMVITYRDVEGCSAAEVCDLLDLTPANQRVVLHRARAKVRAALADWLAVVVP
jgi:RNA polymerase sigma-70 factor (ECF subfamily)